MRPATVNAPLVLASPQPDPIRGILFKASATLGVAVVGALVKALSPRYPLGEIVFCRSFFMLVPVLVTMAMDPRGLALIQTDKPWSQARRSLSGMVGLIASFVALRYLPLADATALTFCSPLFLIALAILILGEKVGPYRTSAAAIGFLGVVLIALPHLDEPAPSGRSLLGVFFGLLAAVAIALVQTSLRALREEPAPTTVFYYTLVITGSSVLSLPFAFRWPDNLGDAVMLVGIGLIGGLAQLLLTQSYRHTDASLLAPYDYLQLVWAMILGYAFFGEAPTFFVIAGVLVIASAGLFIGLRERALARRGPG